MSLLGLLKRKKAPVAERNVKILQGDAGFSLFNGTDYVDSVIWNDVEEVVAYKVDCFTYDTIFLAFKLQGVERPFKVDEEVCGFPLLMESMAQNLPGIDPDWYFHVMFPEEESAEGEKTVLFRR